MITKTPERALALGGPLPPIPQHVVSWPWGGTPHLTAWSVDMLRFPLGTLIYDVVDGHPVLAQIQTHYSYGAHPDWPDKAHKGTSVFVPTGVDASGRIVAVRDAPEGWGDEAATVAGEMYAKRRGGGYRFSAEDEHIVRSPQTAWRKLGMLAASGAAGAAAFNHLGWALSPPWWGAMVGMGIASEFMGENEEGEPYRALVCEPFSIRRYGMIY